MANELPQAHLIRWYDHVFNFGARALNVDPEPCIQTTVGFIVYEGPHMMSVAQTINHDREPCEVLDLLVCDVISKTPLT